MFSRSKSGTYRARQIHRWLGLFIGIQFIAWTVGGLYFSWTDLDEIHGDHLQNPSPFVAADAEWASPSLALNAIRARESVDSVAGLGRLRPAISRDDFNNLVLRAFSVLGLLTIGSGFVLFVLTSSPYRNAMRRRAMREAPPERTFADARR